MTQDKWEYASNYVGVTTDDGVYRKVADVRVAEYAALLGSAPDLLAALELCVADLAEWRMFAAEEREKGSGLVAPDAEEDTIKVLVSARAVIARAKGEVEESDMEQARRLR